MLHNLFPGMSGSVCDKVALIRVGTVLDLGHRKGEDPKIEFN
jgi:hypothetical protein